MRINSLKAGAFALLFIALYPKSINAQIDKALSDSIYLLSENLSFVDPDSAMIHAQKLKKLALKHNDTFNLAEAYYQIGSNYFLKNRSDSSFTNFYKALGLYQKINDSIGISYVYFSLADLFNLENNYIKAINYYEKYLKINLGLGFKESKAYYAQGISLIYIDQEEYGKARDMAEEALVIAKQYKLNGILSGVYNTLAQIALGEEKFILARDLAKSALAYSKKYPDKLEEIWSLKTISAVQSQNKDYEKAKQTILKAIKNCEDYGDSYTTSFLYIDLSYIYRNAGYYKESLASALKAEEISKLSKSKLLDRDINKCLSNVYAALENYERSLNYYKLYKAFNDSINKINIDESILLRENEAKEIENQLLATKSKIQDENLNRNNIILIVVVSVLVLSLSLIIVLIQNIRRRKRYNKLLKEKNKLIWNKQEEIDQQSQLILKSNLELEALNKSKDKIFSILSHDLREPFNHIRGVLDVMTYTDLSNDDKTDLLQKLAESVDSTSEALDNLLLWSKNQLVGIKAKPAKIDLSKVIEGQTKFFKPLIERKSLVFDIDIKDSENLKADVGQLEICLRNLIANAIKFSQKNGKITITGSYSANEYHVCVADKGVGMDEAQINSLMDLNENMSTPGTLDEKGTGLGIMIIKDFMEAHNGKLIIKSELGKGSRFSLVFPALLTTPALTE